jgi:DnaJ-class molecular chaperone
MTRDHYLVLGISRSESDDGIHAAFRVQAKRYHPDIAGQQASPRFREVVEAYEILSDPERRRRYDAELVPQAAQVEPSSIALQSYARRPEPLIPETLSIARDFELRPSRSELLERVRRNFFGSAPKGERLEPLNVVVLLPPEKALTGGVVTVGVPVYHRCPFCRGTGRDLFAACCRCDGSGELSFDEPVEVAFPPFGGTRAVFDVPLQHLGIRNFFLRLQLQVTG